jgi:hypothetical protein
LAFQQWVAWKVKVEKGYWRRRMFLNVGDDNLYILTTRLSGAGLDPIEVLLKAQRSLVFRFTASPLAENLLNLTKHVFFACIYSEILSFNDTSSLFLRSSFNSMDAGGKPSGCKGWVVCATWLCPAMLIVGHALYGQTRTVEDS